jgi:signal transduction histidine kinase
VNQGTTSTFIRREDEAVQLLARATDLLANCTDYEATLEFIASLLVSSLASWCTIDLLTDNGKIERVAVTHRDPAKAFLALKMLQKYPASPSAGRGVYKVIATGKSILIPDFPESLWAVRADDPEHLQMILELGSSSYMCVPLIARGKVVGSIMLLSAERIYDEIDLETAEKLARCIALAVDNVHMFRKMQSTQAQLIQSAKLAALGVISAGIAHEINNPLTIIKGHLKSFENLLQKNEYLTRANVEPGLEKIYRNMDRIVKIVKHVREFSRQSEHQEAASVEVRKLIETSLDLFEDPFQQSKIRVETNFPDKELFVLGDFGRLEQVLVNILANAKDAIVAKPATSGGHIHVRLEENDGRIRLSIADDGIGLKEDYKDRVFEPFFTTKEVGVGTGLGLSISHGIIKDHRGSIDFISEENRGTQVVVELPQQL